MWKNRKLAWSNAGSLAQIVDEGRKIAFRALMRNQKTGDWSLTEISKSPIPAPEGTTWEHIRFNGVGIDLSAVDSHAGVHVFTLMGALGNMVAAQSNVNQGDGPKSELDAVVGLHWLPMFPTEFKVCHSA